MDSHGHKLGPRQNPWVKWDVYGLANPETGNICYIGISFDPSLRLTQHIKQSRHLHSTKDEWIQGLLCRGLKPTLVVLETDLERWDALKLEREWIMFGLEHNWPLFNENKRKRLTK